MELGPKTSFSQSYLSVRRTNGKLREKSPFSQLNHADAAKPVTTKWQ